MKDLIIIGAGGFGREVADTVERINNVCPRYNLLGFADDDETSWDRDVNGIKVLGGIDFIKKNVSPKTYAVIAVASANAKRNIVNTLDEFVIWENIIDPTALVSKFNSMGVGNIIQPFTVIGPNTTIGNHCMINLRGSLGHDAVIEDYVSTMSYCDITGHVHLEKGVYLGSSVCIIPGIFVKENSIIGAGATVIKDINETGTYVGNPARRVK